MEEKLMTESEQWFNEYELEVKDFKYLQKLKGKEILNFFENELQNWKTLQNEMTAKFHDVPSSLRQLTALHQEIDRSNQILKSNVLNNSIDKVKDAANNLSKTVNRLQDQSPLIVYSKS